MMVVFLALMGVLGGGYHPAAPPLVSASVEPRNQGRALGFHLIGGSASFFLSPLIAAAIATIWGWRGPFIVLAVPATVFGIIFSMLLKRLSHTKKTEHSTVSSHSEAPAAPYRWHRLVPFMIVSMFNAAVLVSTISFIPLFLVDHFEVAEETAAALVAVIYSAGLWAAPLGGYLSDRLGNVPVTVVVCLIAGPIVYFLNLAPYSLGIGALLLVIGVIIYIRMPASEAYIISQTSERHRSTVLGILYFGFMEGAGVFTPLMGYLIDHRGFYLTFTIAAAAMVVVTVLCSIWLRAVRE
jgi:predicted MFS family arabinose efflux permease